MVSADYSVVDKTDKYPSLLNFLLSQKRAIEYDTTELRLITTPTIKGSSHYTKANKDSVERREDSIRRQNSKCLFHKESDHWTSD